ncbi:MAG: secretin N-terminal domain-containing protein [Thermoguttaceae bacterium]|nr:secretin N-terminal domain-containing protein [Thermoguttaceae bacterium]
MNKSKIGSKYLSLSGVILFLLYFMGLATGISYGQNNQPYTTMPLVAQAPISAGKTAAPGTEPGLRSSRPQTQTTAASHGTLQKIYRPKRSKADELLLRYLAILPFDIRQQTQSRVFAEENSFMLIGPQQAISLADEMIPRMDINPQLIDGYVDVGVVAGQSNQTGQNTQTRPVTQVSPAVSSLRQAAGPASRQSANTTVSTAPPAGVVPPVNQYYDPNENRNVRVAMQPGAAIMPQGPAETNLSTFGRTNQASAQGSPANVDSRTPDVVVYRVASEQTGAIENRLRTQFASYPEIVIAADARTGRIFIHTTRQLQQQVGQFLGTQGIFPDTAALEQYDPRIQEGTVRPVTGMATSRPAASEVSDGQPTLRSFAPGVKKVQDLEKLTKALFGERLLAIDTNSVPAGSETLTRQAPSKVSYRFTRRNTTGETMVRSCDLQFDFLNQKILIAGDTRLCGQMEQLFRAMDRHSPVQGNVRRFISIRQSDPKKVKEILDIYYSTPQSGALTPGRPFAVHPVATVIAGNSKSSVSPIDSVFPVDDMRKNPIRQTAYQGEGLSGEGLSGGAPAAAGMEGFGPGHDPAGRGVGVVQDYLPQVLPDLDVVIIDAPEAEYKRIENMIREIEELAKLAEPKIEIYNLKHVNCVMLQGILQQLHQEMFVTKQGRVVIFAMQNPNAMLVVGWGQAFASMKDLINVFDQPIADGADMIRVIRLKYASARDMAMQLTTYFPVPQPVSGGFSPRIRVFPDIRTNSLVIHAAPNDLVRIQQILSELDVNQAAPRLRVKTFALKNLLAEDLRRTLMNAILPSVQGTQDNATAKFPILEILSVDAESKRLIESGIMTDVNISADPNNNQLIVTAPEDCMELIEKLIMILDVAPPKAQMKIFRIIYGDAAQMTRTLQSLLPTGGGHMPAVPHADGEDSFVPVRFATDSRTNCIIATASPKDLKIVEALILSLDRKDTMERTEVVIPLRNVQALSIAKAIDDYLSRKQNLEIASEAMSVYQMFESQVIVVPESITNSLIISATPRYRDEIVKLVESFDNDPPQVVIQVLIAEVTLTDHEEFGIEAGLQDTVAFDRSVIKSVSDGVNSSTGIPGFDMVGTNSQGNNTSSTAASSTVAGQLLNTLGVGRTSSDVDFGGLVVSASSRNVQVTLRALKEKNRLQILSRPQITAMDNQQAFILVGQRVPRVDKANMTNYGITSSVTDANVGLILLVTPRVSKEGRVIMEIGAEKSSLAGDDDAIPVFSSGDQIIKSPSINTIQAMTAVSAMDGETVMLGGLITSSRQKRSRGIPWFSDIPYVGWLFRYDKEHEERKELLSVMTPRVVQTTEDLESVKRVEASKMNWCLADAMAINGNMGLHDPLSGEGTSKKKTKMLPFLDRETMEKSESPRAYNPDNDYPAARKQAPARPTQKSSGKKTDSMNKQPNEGSETLPFDIYKTSSGVQGEPVIPQPVSSKTGWKVGSERTVSGQDVPPGAASKIVVPPFPSQETIPLEPSGVTTATAVQTPNDLSGTSPKSDTVDLEMLAKNGYAFSPKLTTGQPIRPAGYEEKRPTAPADEKSGKAPGKRESEQTVDKSEPVPLGLRYSELPQYR